MRLYVMDGTGEGDEGVEATSATIRSALYPAELWYGTEVELRPAGPEAPRLSAICVSNAYIGPEEAGELVLGLEERGACFAPQSEEPLTRDEVRAYFERFVAGDAEWLGEFVWDEIVEGQRTGRQRESA